MDLVGNPGGPKQASEWFNTAAYAVPAGYTYGTASRNSLRTNGYFDLDTSLFRTFPIGGERQFEFRAEAFNLLNHPVLGTPNTDYNSGPVVRHDQLHRQYCPGTSIGSEVSFLSEASAAGVHNFRVTHSCHCR